MIINFGKKKYLSSCLDISTSEYQFIAINYRRVNNLSTFAIMNEEGNYVTIENNNLALTKNKNKKITFTYDGDSLFAYIAGEEKRFYINTEVGYFSDFKYENTKLSFIKKRVNITFSPVDLNYLGTGNYGIVYAINDKEVAKICKKGDIDGYNFFASPFFTEQFFILPKRKEKSPISIFSSIQVIYDRVEDMFTFLKDDRRNIFFSLINIIDGTYFLSNNHYLNLDLKLDNIGKHNGLYKIFDMYIYEQGRNIDLSTCLYHPFIVAKILNMSYNEVVFLYDIENYKKKFNSYIMDKRIVNILIQEISLTPQDFFTKKEEDTSLYQRLHLFTFTIGILLPIIWNLKIEFNQEIKDFILLTCIQGDSCPTKEEVLSSYDKILQTF